MSVEKCGIGDCSLQRYCKGYCAKHYQRFVTWGDPTIVRTANWRNKPYIEGKPITQHRLYGVWTNMKQRCYDSANKSYEYYGGKGIKVCERWRNSFEDFLADMGERPKGYTLDRIDGTGDYKPLNCRWASRKQQANNKSNNRKLTLDGQRHTLAVWAEKTGIKQSTLTMRLNAYGWSVRDTLTIPVGRRRIIN